jgi:Fe-S oxidoreductase
LHCLVPGESLPELPDGVLASEIANLERLGVRIEQGTTPTAALAVSLSETADAVFVDTDSIDELPDLGRPDSLTLGTSVNGVFASLPGERSPILQAAAGRRAANSIDRYYQGVSMVTGRELEGPYTTRLFTSLKGVEPVPPAAVDTGWSEAQARDEARRCLQCECMECVKVCDYLKHYKAYPKVYARQIYNNESIVMGTRQANTMINSCMLCGLCETVCPEDFSMADVCLEARRGMVERDKMPPSAHEFALRDMAFANGDHASLARHAPGAEVSEYVYFPGCQLTASDPDAVEAAYADLRARLGDVGLLLHCCGAPARWSGREALFSESMTELRTKWQSLGSPRVIAACPTCITTLREGLPDAEIVSHWALLRSLGLPQQAAAKGMNLAINDPCAARHNVMLREDVRAILDMAGASVAEPEFSGELAKCCGFGGLLSDANPALAKVVAEGLASSMEEDYVTYCVMCRDMIARTGKRAMHLYDLLYPGDGDPAARPAPGHSQRRENRARLRDRLLRELWQHEDLPDGEPFEAVAVSFTPEAAAIMEERRILKSDVQKVLLHARETGKRFVHEESGRFLAAYRPVVVTYWVEYEETGSGCLVHNAWSHRMRIKGGK